MSPPTPRPDLEAIETRIKHGHYIAFAQDDIPALCAYARALEGERDEALRLAQTIHVERERWHTDCEKAWTERDAAYESRAHWCVEAGKAMQARDAALARCATLTTALDDLIDTEEWLSREANTKTTKLQLRRLLDEYFTHPAWDEARTALAAAAPDA